MRSIFFYDLQRLYTGEIFIGVNRKIVLVDFVFNLLVDLLAHKALNRSQRT